MKLVSLSPQKLTSQANIKANDNQSYPASSQGSMIVEGGSGKKRVRSGSNDSPLMIQEKMAQKQSISVEQHQGDNQSIKSRTNINELVSSH